MVTGSEKQMKWYEEILKEAYDYLDARYNHKIADEVEKQAVSDEKIITYYLDYDPTEGELIECYRTEFVEYDEAEIWQ